MQNRRCQGFQDVVADEIEIGELDDFHPDSLYRKLGIFKALGDLRKRLNNTATFPKAAAEVQKWADAPPLPPKPRRRRSRSNDHRCSRACR